MDLLSNKIMLFLMLLIKIHSGDYALRPFASSAKKSWRHQMMSLHKCEGVRLKLVLRITPSYSGRPLKVKIFLCEKPQRIRSIRKIRGQRIIINYPFPRVRSKITNFLASSPAFSRLNDPNWWNITNSSASSPAFSRLNDPNWWNIVV